jgi:CO/xanthine dehydrogenase Mo-binding subunit
MKHAETPPTTQRASNLLVGSPIERREDLRFLTGRGQYVDDIFSARMLHAVILRSSVAHGRICAIDASAARARPGVHAVITAAEIGTVPTIPLRHDPTPAIRRFEQPVIADGKVRYVGEPIAVVIADSAALAEDALEAVAVDIEPLAVVADRTKAGTDEIVLFETVGTNLPDTITAVRGDAEAAFANAPYRRREHFRVQRHAAVPMEPRGLLAEWDADAEAITVRGVCKVPFTNRRALAQMMGLPEQSVRMVEYDVGGGFGARGEFYPEDFLIPFAARYLRRPVKWTEDRRENRAALRCLHRSRRLCAHQRRDGGAQHFAGDVRPLPDCACARGRASRRHQQNAGRHLSRPGPLRIRFLPRAAVRHGGGRSRHRPRRVPPAQPDRRGGNALQAADRAGARHRERMRQR